MTLRPAFLLLAMCVVPGVSRAQGQSIETAVAEQAAARLGREVRDVVVEWTGDDVAAGGPVRLLGSGTGGAYVVELQVGDRVVRRRVRVGVRGVVTLAARDLERGQALTAADMVTRDTVLWGGSAGTTPESGWVARRRIAAGAVLAAPAVAPPSVVEAGRDVTLVWRSGQVEITARAVAAGTAAVGERVAVRTESGRRLWGIAEAPGRVRIEGSDR